MVFAPAISHIAMSRACSKHASARTMDWTFVNEVCDKPDGSQQAIYHGGLLFLVSKLKAFDRAGKLATSIRIPVAFVLHLSQAM